MTSPRAVARWVGAAGVVLAAATGLVTPQASAQTPSPVSDQYNYSPTSRTLAPTAVHGTSGTVGSPTNVLSGQPTRIAGQGSLITLDFGKEVGGLVTLTFGGSSDTAQQLALAFSETSVYAGATSDDSRSYYEPGNVVRARDGVIVANVAGAGTYAMPADKLRGGFRYLTLVLNTSGWVDVTGVSLEFTAAPGKADPHDYANYFYSNDDLLNKLWYAGAYTVQLDTIAPSQGRSGTAASGWENNGQIGSGASILTDGAKRDRTVWPGDLGVSLPTEFATTDDTVSTRNALDVLYANQTSDGALPYAGPEINATGSDTYHLWGMIGTGYYYRYTADQSWLNGIWPKFVSAMGFALRQFDSNTGLLTVPASMQNDWGEPGRIGAGVEANTLLFQALNLGVDIARAEGSDMYVSSWRQTAARVRSAVNSTLWDPVVGLYRDTPGSTLYPQDGNSLAVAFGLTDSQNKNARIAQALAGRWNNLGAVTPEYPGLIGTFPGSMELAAHLAAGDDVNALDLMRREWGFMLASPQGTGSTFWESFRWDGSFYYDSYMSAAHGWSTGPTSALTFSVLGLAPTSTTGFDFAPHPGNLSHVEGDLTLPQGKATGSWDFADGTLTERLTSPSGSTVRLGIPTYGSRSVTVTVNGTTAWSGGHAFAANGSTDGQYIYLTGLPAGSYTVTATGIASPTTFATSVLPNQLPPGYTPCAAEGGTCTPTTPGQVVAFGAGSYVYRTADGPITCDANAFHGTDPAFGLVKTCYLAPVGGPAGYTTCAASGGTCALTGTHEVAYGADGAFHFRLATGNVACTAAAFDSDPLPGKAKACYVSPGGPPGDWTKCADENGSCAVGGVRPMAYGADGDYWVGSTNGTTACTTDTVGVDPAYGVVKACYTWSGPPPGFARQCAAEHDSCAATGQHTVAFGAAGSYVYRTFDGPAPCTVQAFGSDPLNGTVKACFLTS